MKTQLEKRRIEETVNKLRDGFSHLELNDDDESRAIAFGAFVRVFVKGFVPGTFKVDIDTSSSGRRYIVARAVIERFGQRNEFFFCDFLQPLEFIKENPALDDYKLAIKYSNATKIVEWCAELYGKSCNTESMAYMLIDDTQKYFDSLR